MVEYCGKSVYSGIAIGKIKVYHTGEKKVKRYSVEDVETELNRFIDAKAKAIEELKLLYEKAEREVGGDNAAIFEIHRLMLDDADYLDAITHIIRSQGVNADYAVAVTGKNFADTFSSMADPYMRARATDVRDISERVIRILSGREEEKAENEPYILLADDLMPSETVQLDKTKILAFVTAKGSENSHTAILARTMNIPAIVRADIPIDESMDGKNAAIDGAGGKIYIEPDGKTLKRLMEEREREREQRELLLALKGKEDITKDGKKIKLYANIGDIKDLGLVLKNDAEGVGLFRSEFIYMDRKDFPAEEEQFNIYKSAAEIMAGKKLIVRTLDIGADKKVDYFNLSPEENPAMGLRAIRICITRPEIFKTQLRALFRAATYGNISVMYPMITSLKELHCIKGIAEEVEAGLKREGVPYRVPEQGIMIETPAAVMISDLLAKEVDFFSIGTNDLSQYTMAIDRQNSNLDFFYEPDGEAMMRMIEMTAENGHKAGIWVGICGELGADTSLTEKFLRMGIDELSVAPGRVLSVRKIIRETDLSKKS